MVNVTIDGVVQQAGPDERLVDLINRVGGKVPQVCYHPQLGPIQTCDTCMVEVNGKLVRACATLAVEGMNVATASARAGAAQREAFDRILEQPPVVLHGLRQQQRQLHDPQHHEAAGHRSPEYSVQDQALRSDHTNPFYRYDPNQCILCGRCVAACQNLQVNETLSIRWEDEHPRVLWDGGSPIGESSCVSCGHCVTVCPCNALMEKSMLGHAGYLTDLPKPALDGMIDVVKDIEPETGYRRHHAGFRSRIGDARTRIRRTKTVCTYCGVGCSFDIWTKDRHILKVEPPEGPTNGVSTCIKGKFGWDYVNSPDRLTKPLIREGDKFREASWDEALDLIARRFSEIKATTRAGRAGVHLLVEVHERRKLPDAEAGARGDRAPTTSTTARATARRRRPPACSAPSATAAIPARSRDIEQADLVLIIGSNTAESHPVLATRVKRAHKLRGQKLIVSDLREARDGAARRSLPPSRSRARTWSGCRAVTRYIFDNGLAKADFLKHWVNGVEEYSKSLEPFTMEFACADVRPAGGDAEAGGAHDRRSQRRLHAVGHGRHAALRRVRILRRRSPTCCW